MNVMLAVLDLIRPLFDARMILTLATAGLLMDQLTGSEWGVAVGAAMWWTTGAGAARESKGAL